MSSWTISFTDIVSLHRGDLEEDLDILEFPTFNVAEFPIFQTHRLPH